MSSYRIYDCNCPGWKKQNGLVFDTQDLRESNATRCPCCGTPFKVIDSTPATTPHAPTDEKEVERITKDLSESPMIPFALNPSQYVQIARWHLSQLAAKDKEIEEVGKGAKKLHELLMETVKQRDKSWEECEQLRSQLASMQEAVKVKDEALRALIEQWNKYCAPELEKALAAGKEQP